MQLLPNRPLNTGFRFRLPRLFSRRKAGFQRRHERYTCAIPGMMIMSETGAKFDGLILEISSGGCSFRPASLYLLNRVGAQVSIGTDHFRAEGIIRATRPHSYGIEFMNEMSQQAMDQLMALYGGGDAQAPLSS